MKTSLKVAVFYPWHNILMRNSGASRRTGHMIYILKDEYSEIVCVSPFGMPDTRKENVLYRDYYPDIPRVFSWDAGNALLWCRHYYYAVDPDFAKLVDEITEWADVVIVEYTFVALPVVKSCRRKNKKVIVTAHDVLSNQITESDSFIKKLTIRAEVNALKMADVAVCVSLPDREVFKTHGVNAEVIPHGIDIQGYLQSEIQNNQEDMTAKLAVYNLPRRNICLFVGASHPPNLEAVNIIRRLAGFMQADAECAPVTFIIAGGCCQPERHDNFYALGEVDEQTLQALYHSAGIVLIPLLKGTGASVKTIEAMAYGKAILGTTVAFRGYPVESGMNCIISDDLSSYKRLIIDLLANDNKFLTVRHG